MNTNSATTTALSTAPAIAPALTRQIDVLAVQTGCERDQLANMLMEHALAEAGAGRLRIAAVGSNAGGAA